MQNGSGGRDNDYDDDECDAWHAMTMVMVMVVLTVWLVMYLCVFLVEATGDYIWSKLLYDSRYMLTSKSMNADSVVASSLRLCPRGFLHRLRMGWFSRHRVLFFRRFILPGHVVQKIVVSVIESLDLGSRSVYCLMLALLRHGASKHH